MTKTTPNYLRIHRETNACSSDASEDAGDNVLQFWNAYSEATGWRLDRRAARDEVIKLLPVVTPEAVDEAASPSAMVVGKKAALQLAASAARLAAELDANRAALRRQEAELASRAAILTSETLRTRLADGIENTLAAAAAACGCDAAALYTLDDETRFLKTRFVFGLPTQRLEEPPRELRGSRGDLEAMVQGVVAIDDALGQLGDTWNLPESFAAGICAAVGHDHIPIGTLWLFREERNGFLASETAAARLAAAHLSLQLAQASPLAAPPLAESDVPMKDILQWQLESLPIGAELAEQWRVDGMLESPRRWATGWHTWDVLPDGTLMLAMAEAVDESAKGAMSAAIARAALVAHTGYQHTPAKLMQRISDTLWQTSTGEQLASLLYARIDPETGEGEISSAGSIAAVIGNRFGHRTLIDGGSEPLNTHIDARFVSQSFRLASGETLLAYTRGVVLDGVSQSTLGEHLQTAMQAGDTGPLAHIRRSMVGLPLGHERGAVTLLRL